jgi:hypothetical protein
MTLLNTRTKKWLVVVTATLSMNILTVPISQAQDDSGYLAQIAQYTYGTLQAVNNLPAYLNALVAMAQAWLTQDNSKTTAALQGEFASVANAIMQNTAPPISLQQQLTKDFFGPTITPQTMPNANDLTYQTLLGQPFFNPDPRKTDSSPAPDAAYNYTKNVAGINISHVIPSASWQGNLSNQQKYAAFFVTESAIQTYNASILSQLYTDYSNGNPLSATQQALIKEASSSDWFSQVASESIGIVLRQILMFISQTYILISQFNDTQKKILETQAMTNTLLILGNQQSEMLLLRNAIGPN